MTLVHQIGGSASWGGDKLGSGKCDWVCVFEEGANVSVDNGIGGGGLSIWGGEYFTVEHWFRGHCLLEGSKCGSGKSHGLCLLMREDMSEFTIQLGGVLSISQGLKMGGVQHTVYRASSGMSRPCTGMFLHARKVVIRPPHHCILWPRGTTHGTKIQSFH